MSPTNTSFKRLPSSCVPQLYELEFYPNVNDFTFRGKAVINVLLLEPTNNIILNANQIEILSAKGKSKVSNTDFTVPKESIVHDGTRECVTINFGSTLEKGEFDLILDYKGVLGDDMHGFYRSTWKDANGNEKIILSTQFESTYARRAFPCFDEPDKKAKFRISIVAPNHLTVLSCMPEVSRAPVEAAELELYGLSASSSSKPFMKVVFDETPKMSTYIVAFVIGHFDYSEEIDSNGVRIRVYTPPSRTQLGAHALLMAKTALPFYADVFGAKYPLPKLDLVAIPDFAMGAMENWGLLTYRETALLIDEDESSLRSKRQVAITVAHECAHMWFGNLVTMEWWTHLWLNEGFATWISYLAVDHCFPEYDIWTYFLASDFYPAMEIDGLKSSHPIEVQVHSPAEIDEIFDYVSYAKGASVIRMLNDYMTQEKFTKGLQHYIQKHKYGNTQTQDLWDALSEVAGEDIGAVMSTWTQQMGFPVLNVRKISDSPDGLVIAVEQDRFLIDGSREDDKKSEWYVPVTICDAFDSRKILKHVVVPPSARTQPFQIKLPGGSKIRLNPGAVGFYRVHYEDSLVGPVLEALCEKKLDNKDRLCVLADTFALARAYRVKLTSALTMASTFNCETDFTVWAELRTQLSSLQKLLVESAFIAGNSEGPESPSPVEEAINLFILHLAEAPFKQLGWEARENESNNDALLRPLLLSLLGKSGSTEVIQQARVLFDRHYKAVMSEDKGDSSTSNDFISPCLRVAVYSTCMLQDPKAVYEKLLDLHERATLHDERIRILEAIGSCRSMDVAKRVIELTFTDTVRKQDRLRPLIFLSAACPLGRRAIWQDIRQRIDTLFEELGGAYLAGIVIEHCCSGFCTKKDYNEVQAFFEKHPVSCKRVIQQALESISVNTTFLERDGETATQYLLQFAQNIPEC